MFKVFCLQSQLLQICWVSLLSTKISLRSSGVTAKVGFSPQLKKLLNASFKKQQPLTRQKNAQE